MGEELKHELHLAHASCTVEAYRGSRACATRADKNTVSDGSAVLYVVDLDLVRSVNTTDLVVGNSFVNTVCVLGRRTSLG